MTHVMADLVERYPVLDTVRADVLAAFDLLASGFAAGGTLLVCGNGGSFADSEHIVGELMKGFRSPRPLPAELQQRLIASDPEHGRRLARDLQGALPAIALSAGGALGTAFSNDVDPVLVYAQQVLGYRGTHNMLLALSTSGNSANAVLAAKTARALGMATIAMTGPDSGRLGRVSDIAIAVPGRETAEIQELHLPVYHALCRMLEERFFP